MSDLQILVTLPRRGPVFPTFFNPERIAELESIGRVTWNDSQRQFTPEELGRAVAGKEICVTGWGAPSFDAGVLAHADRLRLIAHTGGSVRPYVTDACYEKGVRAVSGNEVFAESVAESVIAYALASLRDIPRFSGDLARGIWPDSFDNRGLLDRTVGIVGYGMIARYVVGMLQPFHCPIRVFSRHIQPEELKRQGMERAALGEIFADCDVVSIHSGMTPENRHLVTGELLARMKPGALLINTARGPIIDEAALARALRTQDIHAVLDVYEAEPLPPDSPLLGCGNAILMPHMGGPTIDRRLAVTRSVLADIRRFLAGEAMSCEISRDYAAKMSRF